MKLIVTEKNNVAQNIAKLVGAGKGKSDKVIALNEKAFDLGYEKGIELREER